MKKSQLSIVIVILLLLIGVRGSVYTVGEWQQAVVVQLGKIVGDPKVEAGLYFKMPFFQDVRYFDKRILTWDGSPEMVPTADKKYIEIDTTARWRITDPRRFYERVQAERTAMQRISSIIAGKTKNVVSKYKLVETVRNTNEIIQEVESSRHPDAQEAQKETAATLVEVEEKITGEIESISLGREQLSKMITSLAREDVQTLGIELIDVLIKRVSYEPSVQSKVFDRMISERTRIAEKIRSIGKGEEAKIRGKLNLDLKKIESEAYKKAQIIKGKAEAEAITIYAGSLKKDPGYYTFTRTLEVYKKAIPGRANFIISTESELFKMLNNQSAR